MKIKNIITLALVGSFALAACSKEVATDSFDDIKLSSNYVAFSTSGESIDITVTAAQDWKFIVDENFPKVITLNSNDKDGNKISAQHDYYGNLTNPESDIKRSVDAWVKPSVLEGQAGETKVTFTAEASNAGRELTVAILCGTHKQYIVMRQGDLAPVVMTCKQIKEEANVGASYIVEGTVTALGNYASYGAFYVNDGTYDEDVQIYGSTKASREKYNVEVGDKVKFKGTWSSYKNFENVEIMKLTKSLIKIESKAETVAQKGDTLSIKVSFKGKGVCPVIPEDYQDWISILGVSTKSGTKTKIETNPADTAFVKIRVAPNEGEAEREGQVVLTSSTSEVTYTFTQLCPARADYTLTADSLPTSYPTEETAVTLSELDCYVLNVANYGSGIQFKKGGSYIANKTAVKKIKTIKVTCTEGKKYFPENVSLYAGSEAKPEGTAITGTSDDTSTTFDLSSGNYTYFTIKNASNFAVYLGKIEIFCEK